MLDESQHIKNYRSQIGRKAKEVAEMVGDVRIAISGTPVENSVRDLGSMFDFILPGYLTSTRAAFERDFVKPIEGSADRKTSKAERQAQEEQPGDGEEAEEEGAGKQADDPEKQEEDVATERRQLLNRMKDPFLTRRVKTDKKVAPDLPEKICTPYVLELKEQQQRDLHKALEKKALVNISAASQHANPRFARGNAVFAATSAA